MTFDQGDYSRVEEIPDKPAIAEKLYRRALGELGRPELPIAVHSPGHIAETDEEADLLSRSREVWAMRLRTLGNPGPVPSVAEATEAAKAPGAERWLPALRLAWWPAR